MAGSTRLARRLAAALATVEGEERAAPGHGRAGERRVRAGGGCCGDRRLLAHLTRQETTPARAASGAPSAGPLRGRTRSQVYSATADPGGGGGKEPGKAGSGHARSRQRTRSRRRRGAWSSFGTGRDSEEWVFTDCASKNSYCRKQYHHCS
jgi:hypothetical protein